MSRSITKSDAMIRVFENASLKTKGDEQKPVKEIKAQHVMKVLRGLGILLRQNKVGYLHQLRTAEDKNVVSPDIQKAFGDADIPALFNAVGTPKPDTAIIIRDVLGAVSLGDALSSLDASHYTKQLENIAKQIGWFPTFGDYFDQIDLQPWGQV